MALIEGTGTGPEVAGGEVVEGALVGLRALLEDVVLIPVRGGAEGARVGADVGTRGGDLPSPSEGHGV